MPNWVTVRVKAQNPQVLSDKLLSAYTQEQIDNEENFADNGEELEKFVDFNKLIPTPSDLNIQSGTCSYRNEDHYYDFQKDKVMAQKDRITPILERIYKEGMTQKEYVEVALPIALSFFNRFEEVYNIPTGDTKRIEEDLTNILKGFYNFKTYGNVDWYDFHNAKWGTKWNAQTTYVDEKYGYVEFQTAWSCPFELLEELAKYTDIAVSYADEDTGSNYGVYTITNGVKEDVISCSRYNELTDADKIRAITTATVITMGEIYDINEDIFGHYEDGEFNEYFHMPKEEVIEIAQESASEVQAIVGNLGLLY